MDTEKKDECSGGTVTATDFGNIGYVHVEMDCFHNITRRDWLAGLAMQAIVSKKYSRMGMIMDEEGEYIPKNAYKLADAMINEGKK